MKRKYSDMYMNMLHVISEKINELQIAITIEPSQTDIF